MTSSSTISVIIPVYDEEDFILSCIGNVKGYCGDNCEIIVVDGSPGGSTLAAVDDDEVLLLSSPPGRAVQMNYGAQRAQGDILLFLHADTSLPSAADRLVREALAAPGASAGAFKLGFNTSSRAMKFIAFIADLRCRMERVPYGDQAIFVKKKDFCDLGGFPEIPLMEDVELFQTIKKKKLNIVILKEGVSTSPRRYLEAGPLRCAFRNTILRLLHLCKVSPARLATMYRRREKQS